MDHAIGSELFVLGPDQKLSPNSVVSAPLDLPCWIPYTNMWDGLLLVALVAVLVGLTAWGASLWFKRPPPVRRSTIFKTPTSSLRTRDIHHEEDDFVHHGAYQPPIRTGRRPFVSASKSSLLEEHFKVPTSVPPPIDQPLNLEPVISSNDWYVQLDPQNVQCVVDELKSAFFVLCLRLSPSVSDLAPL